MDIVWVGIYVHPSAFKQGPHEQRHGTSIQPRSKGFRLESGRLGQVAFGTEVRVAFLAVVSGTEAVCLDTGPTGWDRCDML